MSIEDAKAKETPSEAAVVAALNEYYVMSIEDAKANMAIAAALVPPVMAAPKPRPRRNKQADPLDVACKDAIALLRVGDFASAVARLELATKQEAGGVVGRVLVVTA